ncbi:bifunctional helix-turn-helix transcriptional regulator/GNAT family N-acetyltransferase [Achromobacter denitrificans]|uniref:bifunctional helix-turn-helix transcriptional regulator/GNAT family N-acetyltransferase n=1 Tax=Achromobacter denitrificans TaxID=32002 RepID=UPI0023E40A42|nr:helix-turn-helix domain-containing GNAT family N-acetyltransferase [Achromobacter denitrificans]MDF3847924.1 helix-turn-helix domain-containing GNAT family N-acetyltransferase [Achromobacter denitrificans]MDF3860254.1 helix-turn-helix domain-containing GNAT family N-acetyltransferase [Achromobacter denitrificans]MDF3940179.1 helix-turn-helix domain-containing GNAT family N-acetyltransferase [Achromobacter denitrificans]
MSDQALYGRAEAVRKFNRFYTRHIGVLHEHLLASEFSLTEVRILYELAHRPAVSTSDLCRELNLDAGYVSRVVSGFEKQGLIAKTRSAADARVAELALTEAGRAAFAPLDRASRNEVIAVLEQLPEPAQQQLVGAMNDIQNLLSDTTPAGYLLRDPLPGDMGLVVANQAMVYAREYGWNAEYEALVAEIVAKFIREFDRSRERCWIAEKDGRMVGSVFVVRQDDTTAKLRLLYVDASARGLGIGRRLVDECLRFAKQAGYARMMLWTNSVLADARRIYEKAGFQLIEEEAHHSFGQDLVGQVWARDL